MSYKLLASDFQTVIFEAPDYDAMWRELITFRDEQLDQNIDGLVIQNDSTMQWDYAWRVARNMNDLKI